MLNSCKQKLTVEKFKFEMYLQLVKISTNFNAKARNQCNVIQTCLNFLTRHYFMWRSIYHKQSIVKFRNFHINWFRTVGSAVSEKTMV